MSKTLWAMVVLLAAGFGADQYQDFRQGQELGRLGRLASDSEQRVEHLERENARLEEELSAAIGAVRREADAAVQRVAAASDTQDLRDQVDLLSSDVDDLMVFVEGMEQAGLGTAQSVLTLRRDVDSLESEVYGVGGTFSSRVDDLEGEAHKHCSGIFC